MIQIIGLYGVLAMSFTIGRMLLNYVPPFFLIGIRMILAGILILGAQYFWYRQIKIKKQDWGLFFIISMIHIFIPYVTEFIALQSIAPSCAALIFNLTPCFTALFSYLIFGELMTITKWIGFLIAAVGVWYMIAPSELYFCNSLINVAYLLVLVSVISAALGWVLVRKMLQRGYSPLHLNGMSMLMAGVMALICSWFVEPGAHLPWDNMGHFLFLLISIILIANVIFYNMYGYLLRHYSATLLSFIGFITPQYTALYDWLLLNISVGLHFYGAVVIIGLGIYIFYHEELRQGYVR